VGCFRSQCKPYAPIEQKRKGLFYGGKPREMKKDAKLPKKQVSFSWASGIRVSAVHLGPQTEKGTHDEAEEPAGPGWK
jgi:hypothetical protein